jgi:hypothetical protein
MKSIALVAVLLAPALSTAVAAPATRPTASSVQPVTLAGTGVTQGRICMHLRCPGFN